MNSPRFLVQWFRGLACALSIVFCQPFVSLPAQEIVGPVYPFPVQDANGVRAAAYSTDKLRDSLLGLLRTGDAEAFATALTPTPSDLAPIALRYPDTKGSKKTPEKLSVELGEKRARLAASARRLLARAAGLGVDFGAMELAAHVPETSANAGHNYLRLLPEGHWFNAIQRLEIVVSARSANAAAKTGDYRVAVADIIAIPDAWRIDGPLSWAAMPESAADEDMRLEMKLTKVAAGYGSLSGSDDPALVRLAETLVTLLRGRDIAAYERAATLTPEAEWALRLRQDPGAASYPKADFIQWHEEKSAKNHAAVDHLLATLAGSGIDLGAAQVRVTDVGVGNLMVRGATDPMIGLEGSQLRIVLRVEGEGKAANGHRIAGEYVLAVGEILRDGGAWWVEKEPVWEKLPEGVIDDAVAAGIAFEAHVSKTGTLPIGAVAPDVEFIRIADGEKGRLADLRGKIVILDFWAVWCGPCQEPMAEMQTYAGKNPAWGDRVAVVSLSIDDQLASAKAHLENKGWTKSLNLWGGEGGWGSQSAKAFRVSGVPTCYVLDAAGKVVAAGHPASLRAPDVVNRLLAGP